jgi:hypothetical protein
MLMKRLFAPEESQLVYHYCSAESFRAILESGKIRFSDINMLNDASEYRWGYSVFEEAATRLIKRTGVPDATPTLDIAFFNAVDDVLSKGQIIAHPFISCVSLDGNSLDQWRKYADDGRGYAIGFLATALRRLPISLLEVSHDPEEQVREMMTALVALHARSPTLEMPLRGEAFEDAALISAYMAALKHPSFSSEREVRCLHAISLEKIGQSFRFVDKGGQDDKGHEVIPGEKVSFAVRDGALSAYVDVPFTLPGDKCSVTEVALGPKNPTAVGNVFLFLASLGHPDIAVRPSRIPYR